MTEDEVLERGKHYFEKCYGGLVPLPEDVEPDNYWGSSMKLFSEFWGDERLSFRDKRLLVFGTLAGLGSDPSTFQVHAMSALKNQELTVEELRSVVSMLIPYVGLAQTSRLFMASEQAIAAASARSEEEVSS